MSCAFGLPGLDAQSDNTSDMYQKICAGCDYIDMPRYLLTIARA